MSNSSDLVTFETRLSVYHDFEGVLFLLDLYAGRPSEVTIWVVAMPERQRIDVVMVLVLGVAVVEEASNAATLRRLSAMEDCQQG